MERKISGISGAYAFTRRRFIASAAAVAFGGRTFAVGTGGKGLPALKFGVLSDVHVRNPESGDREVIERALTYFRDRGADAVVIAGDLTDEGTMGQAEIVSQAWYKVFPGDKAPDGRKVEKVFIIGNHEHDAAKMRLKRILKAQGKGNPFYERGEAIADDFAGNWDKLFHEPWAKQYEKEVRGFKFFASHWVEKDEMEDVASFIDARLAGYGDGRPFFHVQHPHPYGTVRGSFIHGMWMGRNAFNALSKHPNAISFSGHSHTSLTDERTLWQGAFTAVGTSTLRRVSVGGAEENAAARKDADGRMMPAMVNNTMGRQGQFVEVYDDRVVVERREFVWGESLGPDRVIPWPPVRKPFEPDALEKATPAPEFAAGAAVEMSAPFDGKTRGGAAVRQVTVSFPPARGGAGRVYAYDIEASGADGETVTKTYLQERLFLTPKHWPKRNAFQFPADAAGKGRILRVYPKNCFGLRGRPVSFAVGG